MKLFILHGWTYQTATWDAVRRLLAERHIEYEFLAIPGLTDGTNPVWTLDNYVEWLRGKIAVHDKVALWGHSNGGRISLAFTAKYPEKVAHLILEDSAGIPPRGLRKLKRDFFKKLSEFGQAFHQSEALRNVFYKIIRENDYRQATPEMKKTLSNLASVDLGKVLDRIHTPTLIIWGAGDTVTPLSAGETLHKGIQGSRLHSISDARHSPHITHPREVVDLVEKELA